MDKAEQNWENREGAFAAFAHAQSKPLLVVGSVFI